jgi:hypothetical protein
MTLKDGKEGCEQVNNIRRMYLIEVPQSQAIPVDASM